MNHPLTPEQILQINAEKSRRLHNLLIRLDEDLRELEANPTRYTVSDYNLRFQAIQSNREQTRQAIEDLAK